MPEFLSVYRNVSTSPIAKPEFSHWKRLQYIFVLTGDSFHWEYVGNMQTCGAGDLDYSIFQAKGR